MATTKNITMKQFNGTDYDTLYPKTIAEQVDGIYGKDEILSNSTKALYGLTDSAVPDDVLALLSRFQAGLGNEYVWEKTTQVTEEKYDESVLIYSSGNIIVASYFAAPVTYYYSESFELSSSGGSFVLTNPKSFENSKSNYAQLGQYDVLKGKYVITNAPSSNFMDFYPSDCSIYATTIDSYTTVVASTKTIFSNPRKETKVTNYGYVNSPDPNAYPPAVSDGYTYTPLGQMGAKVQIATGSYTGTGTYGTSNPNSLTFEFRPKILFLFDASGYLIQLGSPSDRAIAFLQNLTESYVSDVLWSWLYNNNYTNAKFSENTLYWYHASGANYQLNTSGTEYYYIAIG